MSMKALRTSSTATNVCSARGIAVTVSDTMTTAAVVCARCSRHAPGHGTRAPPVRAPTMHRLHESAGQDCRSALPAAVDRTRRAPSSPAQARGQNQRMSRDPPTLAAGRTTLVLRTRLFALGTAHRAHALRRPPRGSNSRFGAARQRSLGNPDPRPSVVLGALTPPCLGGERIVRHELGEVDPRALEAPQQVRVQSSKRRDR
jgi:hypothetical protein